MTSVDTEIQKLLYRTLTENAAVMALVDGVHDRVPPSPWGVKEAYISFGAMDAVPDDADCVAGEEITVQIDVWSRKTGKLNCQAICKAVKEALHLQPLTLSENAIVEVELILRRIFTDQDGLTTHGALQFRIAVEEAG